MRASLRFRPRSSRDRGFALPAVLIALVALAGLATYISLQSRRLGLQTHLAEAQIRETLLLQSAISRGAIALVMAGDPLLEQLRAKKPFLWSFEGQSVWMEMTAESGKIDLNKADPAFIARVLDRVAPGQGVSVPIGRGFTAPDQILRPEDRSGRLSYLVHRYFTVTSGQSSIAIASAPRDLVEILDEVSPGESGGNERPVYTIGAWLEKPGVYMQSTFFVIPERNKFVLVANWRGNIEQLQ